MIYEPFRKLVEVLSRNQMLRPATSGPAGDNAFDDTSFRIRTYMRPDCGWFVVERLCAANMAFPIFPEGKINRLFQARLWKMWPDLYGDHPSIAPVIHAHSLHADGSNLATRAVLNAALIAKDATIETVAAALGLPEKTVEAYEVLFFNVLDRRDDAMYLCKIVYPNHRLVELCDNYLEETSLDVLLLRIGYNRGLEAVLYAAGLKDNPTADMTATEAAAALEQAILSTGCGLVGAGLLNGKKMHPAIKATMELVNATRTRWVADGGNADGSMGEVLGRSMEAGLGGVN